MNNLSKVLLLLLTVTLAATTSCEKLELPPKEQDHTTSNNTTNNSNAANGKTDAEEVDKETEDTPAPTPIEADYCVWDLTDGDVFYEFNLSSIDQSSYSINKVSVSGHIVGYCSGTTMSAKSVRFSAEGAKESNIVIADNVEEQSWQNCVAVSLAKANKSQAYTREMLNLVTNPNNLGRQVIVWGNIKRYMGKIGVKEVYGYQFID